MHVEGVKAARASCKGDEVEASTRMAQSYQEDSVFGDI